MRKMSVAICIRTSEMVSHTAKSALKNRYDGRVQLCKEFAITQEVIVRNSVLSARTCHKLCCVRCTSARVHRAHRLQLLRLPVPSSNRSSVHADYAEYLCLNRAMGYRVFGRCCMRSLLAFTLVLAGVSGCICLCALAGAPVRTSTLT